MSTTHYDLVIKRNGVKLNIIGTTIVSIQGEYDDKIIEEARKIGFRLASDNKTESLLQVSK